MPDREAFDPIAEARRQWSARWPEHADYMAAVPTVMRVQQLLLAGVEDILKPYALTFAAYEALRLLAFTRTGLLPMGKMGERLVVHRLLSPTPSAGSNSEASSGGSGRHADWPGPPLAREPQSAAAIRARATRPRMPTRVQRRR